MIDLLYTFIVFLTIIIAVTRIYQSKGSPPGPYPWPVIGNLRLLRRLVKKFGTQHNAFLHLTKKYKSNVINLYLGNSNVIVVSGYDTIQKVLHDENYNSRPWTEFARIRNMGLRKGITMNDGPEWKEMRSWLVRGLKNLGFGRTEMTDKINEEVEIVIEKLRSLNNKAVHIKHIIAPAVFNILWSFITGKRISDESRLRYLLDLMKRRTEAFDIAGGLLSVYPWLRHIAPQSSGYELLSTVNEEFREFLLKTIDEHKENYFVGKEADFIDMFLTEMHNGKGPEAGFTEDQLMVILIDIFIAGLITSAVTLDFLFSYITAHQDVQCKLHEELDSVIDKMNVPQLSDRSKLPFTEAVITESQRLRLATPIIGPRRALKATTLDGYAIPKNSVILINLYSVHTDPEYFDDPLSFKPERFLHDGVFVPDKRLIFFGRGPRRCPGEIFAKPEIFLIFAGIMRRFQILPMDNILPDTEPLPGITISPKPYKVLLRERTK